MKNIICFLILACSIFIFVGCSKSNFPEEMPEDFTFKISWGFDGKYDSNTKVLSNGYNYDLDTKCETELELTDEELKEIYKIIKKANIDKYEETVKTKNSTRLPSSDLTISVSFGEENYSVSLIDSYLSDNMFFYKEGRSVGRAIKEIVENYITNSEEYKSLPRNQKVYE